MQRAALCGARHTATAAEAVRLSASDYFKRRSWWRWWSRSLLLRRPEPTATGRRRPTPVRVIDADGIHCAAATRRIQYHTGTSYCEWHDAGNGILNDE